MINKVIDQAQSKAAQTARSAAIGFGAGLFMLAGLAFATLAAWLVLVAISTALNAALILSAAYFAIAFFLLAFARVRNAGKGQEDPRIPHAGQQTHQVQPQDLIIAFMTGVTAGRNAQS